MNDGYATHTRMSDTYAHTYAGGTVVLLREKPIFFFFAFSIVFENSLDSDAIDQLLRGHC